MNDNACDGVTVVVKAPGALMEVHAAYNEATDEDKLLCLQNLQSWIDGERKRLSEED